MSGTALAVGIDGLVAVYTPAAPPGVKVIDGEPKDPPPKHLCVGWAGPGEAAAAARPVPADAGWSTVDDTCVIDCLLSFWDGKKSVTQIRAELVEAYNTFDVALRADHTLGGIGMAAFAGGLEYFVDRSREGTYVLLRWSVTVRAIV